MKGAEAEGGNTSGVGEEKQKPAGAGRPETTSEGRDLDDAKDFRFEPVPEKNPADADGLYRLGCMATDGAGDAPEAEARAMEFFRKAAAKGYAKAQSRLGCMLLAQWRCAEARAWFWKAAEQGVPQAQTELGSLLLYVSGGDRNDSMAARALSAAAAQGEPRAMPVLSLMAEHGLGMPKNEAEAERWQEGARAAGARATMDAFRKETEGMLRNWGVIGLEPLKRFKGFLSTLETLARRIGFLALLLGIELAISGLAGIATDSRHRGTGSLLLLSVGSVPAGAGALGMTGMLDRLWSWILHGSKRR
ncbi:MAG: hypothetical protein K6E40_16675 [Desulfovibrio sp.]|nr:hypothetical protein [Desulfovibrio sp.]